MERRKRRGRKRGEGGTRRIRKREVRREGEDEKGRRKRGGQGDGR